MTIPNFNIFREDRSNGTRYGGSAIYVHKSLKVERLDWFNGLESLAVNIVTESIRFFFFFFFMNDYSMSDPTHRA